MCHDFAAERGHLQRSGRLEHECCQICSAGLLAAQAEHVKQSRAYPEAARAVDGQCSKDECAVSHALGVLGHTAGSRGSAANPGNGSQDVGVVCSSAEMFDLPMCSNQSKCLARPIKRSERSQFAAQYPVSGPSDATHANKYTLKILKQV